VKGRGEKTRRGKGWNGVIQVLAKQGYPLDQGLAKDTGKCPTGILKGGGTRKDYKTMAKGGRI